MKKVFLACKITAITVFGILAALSTLMFPLLIGSSHTKTAIIGWSYLGLLLISISVVYLVIKKDLK